MKTLKPELIDEVLHALEEVLRCLEWHEKHHGVGMDALVVEQARAVLAKVEGCL